VSPDFYDLFTIFTFIFFFGVWVRQTYLVMALFIRVEGMKPWKEIPARIQGVLWTGSPKPGRFYIFRSIWSKIAGREKFHFRAIYSVGDASVACDKFSALPSLRASDRIFLRKLMREGNEDSTIFQNPEDPLDCVLLPPDKHFIRGYAVRHLILTALICASIATLVI
jgi:hypothetical protein